LTQLSRFFGALKISHNVQEYRIVAFFDMNARLGLWDFAHKSGTGITWQVVISGQSVNQVQYVSK